MTYSAINLTKKLDKFSEYWSPKIIAQMNDYHVKLVKFQGDFVWHSHADTDEAFIVIEGQMSMGMVGDGGDGGMGSWDGVACYLKLLKNNRKSSLI